MHVSFSRGSFRLATSLILAAGFIASGLLFAWGLFPLGARAAAPVKAAYAPSVSTSVVISEFRTRGSGGASDEFVELFNLSNAAVDISGWKINGSNATAGTSTRITITGTVILQPGQHYLAVNNAYNDGVAGDGLYGTGIADDGGVALLNTRMSLSTR